MKLDDIWHELDRWSAQGLVADFWIRDDDAFSFSSELDQLLRVCGDIPLALSVIPGRADTTLSSYLKDMPSVRVWQHGWLHRNWAQDGNSEYPATRSLVEVADEIRRGKEVMASLFGSRALPVFVPPWSGFHDKFFPILEQLDFVAYSSCRPRKRKRLSNVWICNVHCELLDWTACPPSFEDQSFYISTIVDHLAGRRQKRYDIGEPTGILTHHRDQDAKSYEFLAELIGIVNGHGAARWTDPFDCRPRITLRNRVARAAKTFRPIVSALARR